MTANWRGPPT